jgi:ankyrin repeat protein
VSNHIYRNKSGNTPLHVACENGNLDCVGILLQSRSKGGINNGNKDKSTPLHLACQSGRRDVVTFLLENGASINQGDKKETTPLFESCRKGDGHITELLLQHGIPPLDRDCNNIPTQSKFPFSQAT